MSNNIATLEGIVSILEYSLVDLDRNEKAATGLIQTIAHMEPHPLIVTGRALDIVLGVMETLGDSRFWARIHGKLVSFPGKSFIFAKSIIPTIHIRADDAEGYLSNPSYQEVAAITLNGYIHPPKNIGSYLFASVPFPMIETTISTDKRYSGGDHKVSLIGDSVQIYRAWIEDKPNGFYAVIQGKLETTSGTVGVKAMYLRPTAQMRTGELRKLS